MAEETVERFHCTMVRWEQVDLWAREVAAKVVAAGARPDVIVGLTRGGWVAARLLCDLLGIKELHAVNVDHWGVTATPDGAATLTHPLTADVQGKRVLVVDDLTDTGASLRLAREHVHSLAPARVQTAVLLHITHSILAPDFFSTAIPADQWAWFIFPWNVREDLRTLCLKALNHRAPRSTLQVAIALQDQFTIDVDTELLAAVLLEGVEAGTIQWKGEGSAPSAAADSAEVVGWVRG